MLDEPTNHLDVDAKSWLMTFLRGFRGALLVISHDLDLLDQAITRVLHLDDGELIEYKGTYSQYLVARKTSVFAVREVRVEGAPPRVASSIRDALRPLLGSSLVAFDRVAAERRAKRWTYLDANVGV